jgi:hypothetical protein
MSGGQVRPEAGMGELGVAEVVRRVVAEVAPAELPVAEGLDRVGGARAARLLARRGRRRAVLGFGVGEVVVMVTPVVWVAVDEMVRRAADDAVDSLGGRAAAWLRRLRRKPDRAVVRVPPSGDQLAAVSVLVKELGVKAGMEPGKAEVLADRVVAHLVLAPDPSAAQHTPAARRLDASAGSAGQESGPAAEVP